MSPRETIKNLIKDGTVTPHLRRQSDRKEAVRALQTILFELGYGKELNWQECGGGTTRALKAFAGQEDIPSDGRILTIELANRIIERLAGFYGDGLVEDVKPLKKPTQKLSIREAVEGGRSRIYVSVADNQVRLTRFKKGAYFFGIRPGIAPGQSRQSPGLHQTVPGKGHGSNRP